MKGMTEQFYIWGEKLQSILNYSGDGFLANGLSNSLHQMLLWC